MVGNEQQPVGETGQTWRPRRQHGVAGHRGVADHRAGRGQPEPGRAARIGGTGRCGTGIWGTGIWGTGIWGTGR